MSQSPANLTASPRLGRAAMIVVAGSFGLALACQSLLNQLLTAGVAFSPALWKTVVRGLGGILSADEQSVAGISLPFYSGCLIAGGLCLWVVGSGVATLISRRGFKTCFSEWGQRGWGWLLLPFLWDALRLGSVVLEFDQVTAVLLSVGHFTVAIALAGLSAEWCATALGNIRTTRFGNVTCATLFFALCLCSVGVFTWMNWQLYHGLLIPHGDSAMYEEHLWNLTHGKGFRSYIDQGLFLGEHIQVIHLLLLPIHWLWPSQLSLEFCESLFLALGALPVYAITRRHTDSSFAALCVASAWLLYFPLHFLDISIDGKTFRPMSLGVPAFMQALNLIDKKRLKLSLIFLLLALSAKEDFAAVIAPVGLWLLLFGTGTARDAQADEASLSAVTQSLGARFFGLTLMVVTTAYLGLAVTTIIPAFREGDTVHFARYFGELGSTPGEIAKGMLTNPSAVFERIFSLRSLQYSLLLLVPLGGLAIASFARLLVGVPLFAVLCLLQLDSSPGALEQQLVPFHHFHAPLIPVLFWAAAAGAGNLARRIERKKSATLAERATVRWPAFALGCAVFTGALFSISPAGIAFWDAGSFHFWKTRYIPGPRAEYAQVVEDTIPDDARVASTDFIHTRLTHRERSYDYSDYLRRVSDYQATVPDDTDFIVVDTQHHYSKIKTPDQIPEFKQHPDQWELLLDRTDGYFIILRKR